LDLSWSWTATGSLAKLLAALMSWDTTHAELYTSSVRKNIRLWVTCQKK
jgi:hypothetical protein